jgi:NADH-quinone oxidoreductase subunit L
MVTAIYTFRALFMTFHGKPRMDAHTLSHVKESPWVVWFPLVMLAIPSVILGYVLFMPMLYNVPGLLSASIFTLPEHNVLAELSKEVVSPWQFMLHSVHTLVFWLTIAGVVIAWVCYIALPSIPVFLVQRLPWLHKFLLNKFGFDLLYDALFVRGAKLLGRLFYRWGDQTLIDGFFVNGTADSVKWFALKGRGIQSGYLYHYIAVMVFGVLGFLCWLLLG